MKNKPEMCNITQHLDSDVLFTVHLPYLETLTEGMIEYQWLADEFAKHCPIDKWNEICNRFEIQFGKRPIVYRPFDYIPRSEVRILKDSD